MVFLTSASAFFCHFLAASFLTYHFTMPQFLHKCYSILTWVLTSELLPRLLLRSSSI